MTELAALIQSARTKLEGLSYPGLLGLFEEKCPIDENNDVKMYVTVKKPQCVECGSTDGVENWRHYAFKYWRFKHNYITRTQYWQDADEGALAGAIVTQTANSGLHAALAKFQQPENKYLHVRIQADRAWGEWVVAVFESNPDIAALKALLEVL